MRVLAIDTALAACSAAVLDTEQARIIASKSLPMIRGHAEALIPLLARLLDESLMTVHDLDRVVVTTGPGSFTGLRVGIAAARGIALAGRKPAVGVSTLAAYAAPYMTPDETLPVVAAIDARHDHVYLQVFGAGGRTVIAPRLAALSEAMRAAAAAPCRIVGSAARAVAAALSATDARPATSRRPRRSRHCLGGADGRRHPGKRCAAGAAIPVRARCAAAERRPPAAPMMSFVSRLLARAEPTLSEARPRDAAAIAAVHTASFQRGWGEDEIHRLLTEKNVIAHRAMMGVTMVGFIMSRLAGGEAEILLVAMAPARRGRGFSRPLLDLHLRRLAGLGANAVFLEVDADNAPARALYRRAGFYEVGQRQAYYTSGAAALVLRRDLGG